ncbi:hypothetical protein ACA29_02470 [Lederbergia galactosidilytica]|uniref:Uncharacterized protein n=1 Tax=Lederbergia galactosidilytica TaxID=217031 RepID=A0A0Q9Y7W2_9BACI|nr:hypothetical protein ACA29_02470 [Lederbergia galactosidilytica]
MSGYTLKLDNFGQVQKEDDLSFIGGQPRIPENLDIPSCSLCGSEQTFFFQIAFPEGHSWQLPFQKGIHGKSSQWLFSSVQIVRMKKS